MPCSFAVLAWRASDALDDHRDAVADAARDVGERLDPRRLERRLGEAEALERHHRVGVAVLHRVEAGEADGEQDGRNRRTALRLLLEELLDQVPVD